jgi:glutamine amidotransferase/cyclase
MITLLDYGAGNVRSVINAIERLGETVHVVTSARDILAAEKLVFPGVGAFGNMMRILNEKNYVAPLKAYLQSNRPFFGICLGMQALFGYSEEAPDLSGLKFIQGSVKRFDTQLSVPHIGWNGVTFKQPSRIFNGVDADARFYFVHSYHVDCEDRSVILTTTNYGYEFVSSIQKDICQQYPEG